MSTPSDLGREKENTAKTLESVQSDLDSLKWLKGNEKESKRNPTLALNNMDDFIKKLKLNDTEMNDFLSQIKLNREEMSYLLYTIPLSTQLAACRKILGDRLEKAIKAGFDEMLPELKQYKEVNQNQSAGKTMKLGGVRIPARKEVSPGSSTLSTQLQKTINELETAKNAASKSKSKSIISNEPKALNRENLQALIDQYNEEATRKLVAIYKSHKVKFELGEELHLTQEARGKLRAIRESSAAYYNPIQAEEEEKILQDPKNYDFKQISVNYKIKFDMEIPHKQDEFDSIIRMKSAIDRVNHALNSRDVDGVKIEITDKQLKNSTDELLRVAKFEKDKTQHLPYLETWYEKIIQAIKKFISRVELSAHELSSQVSHALDSYKKKDNEASQPTKANQNPEQANEDVQKPPHSPPRKH